MVVWLIQYIYLLFENLIDILPDATFDFYAKVRGSDATLVLVYGDYDLLNQDLVETFPSSEVSSIDIINAE